MKITALIENTSCRNDLCTEHGLSLYIEANGKNIVFDTGMSETFAKNAKDLGKDIAAAELCVISHGHYDHGGGIRAFMEENQTAPVYIREGAFIEHYAQRPDELFYCGLDKALIPNGRFIFTDPICVIDENLSIFSETPAYEPIYESSRAQKELVDGEIVQDKFLHEQNLVIKEGDKYTLIAGCAHSGIYNIITRFRELYGCDPSLVVGGFHLMIPSLKKPMPDEAIDGLAAKLKAMENTQFYTCHCTGEYAFNRLQSIMGDQVRYLATGMTIEN